MLLRLKRRADSFDNWATEVKRSLDPSDPKVGELIIEDFFFHFIMLTAYSEKKTFDSLINNLAS